MPETREIKWFLERIIPNIASRKQVVVASVSMSLMSPVEETVASDILDSVLEEFKYDGESITFENRKFEILEFLEILRQNKRNFLFAAHYAVVLESSQDLAPSLRGMYFLSREVSRRLHVFSEIDLRIKCCDMDLSLPRDIPALKDWILNCLYLTIPHAHLYICELQEIIRSLLSS